MLKSGAKAGENSFVQAGMLTVSLAGGYLLSGAELSGVVSFADISLTGACPLPYSAGVFAGSLICGIVSGSIGRSIVKIAAMLMILIFKLLFDSFSDAKSIGISTGICIFISGMAVSAILGDAVYKLLFYALYSALGGFTAYSAASAAESIRHERVIDISGGGGCACAVVYTVLVSSLCSADIPYINIGVVLGGAVTLLAAYHYGYTGGIICGALTACGAFAAASECGMTAVMLPAAGFLTGYLNRHRAVTAAAFFTGVNFVFMVFTENTSESFFLIITYVLSSLIFMAVSPEFSDKWIVTGKNNEVFGDIVEARMKFLADSMENVRSESGRITELLSGRNIQETVTESGANAVCRSCQRHGECWGESAEKTLRGFRKVSKLPEISREAFPYELRECVRSDELAQLFRQSAEEKRTAKLLSLRMTDSRRLLGEQIRITGEIIEAAGKRNSFRCSETISRSIRTKLESCGYELKGVSAYYNAHNRLTAEIYFASENAPENYIRVCDLASDGLKLPLCCGEPFSSGQEVRIRLYEPARYEIEVYGASVCADENRETGDTTAVFDDGAGTGYVVLSDGMGTGKSAALESKMVVSMFRRLIGSGVNSTTAIKLINSIMLTKSQNEAFATLDALMVDLDTCEATLMKSGAAATLIRHGGKVRKVASATFPIGMFGTADTYSGNFRLEEGDAVIMFSDGINEGEYRYIKELLLGEGSLRETVGEICRKAETFNPNVREDDVTVIGITVRQNEKWSTR